MREYLKIPSFLTKCTQKVVLDPEAGLRIATFMFYMSEVDVGGATIFPYANLTLWPRKGSALLWFNLHEDGVGDEWTRHAACPVERGSKWGKREHE